MSSVVIAGDTSGSVTLSAPAVAGTTVLTLPATSGTVVVTATGTAGFPSGTRMSFQQTAAPTGWTKDTTAGINNSALRLVTGSVVNGGSVDFTTAFTSQTPTITTSGLSAGATTLSSTQIPSHTHTSLIDLAGMGGSGGVAGATGGKPGLTSPVTGSTGGGGSHTHTISGTATSSAINLTVKYYDFIIATAN